MEESERVIEFWFGDLTEEGLCEQQKSARWYQGGADFDAEIKERFCGLFTRLLSGERPSWSYDGSGMLASVIVLDQFSRNMFRATSAMFSADPKALSLALEAIALGHDQRAPAAQRSFFYMPLMHSEEVRMQSRCVELFEAFANGSHGQVKEFAEGGLKYAVAHRDIVQRFGRFPHRNVALGRVSTREELDFLEQPGSAF
jgi:uncharacterized protein (DUF924 family)